MSEPTTSEFLNAANWTYTRSSTTNPADLKPLLVNGKQLTMQVTSDGFYGAAFVSPSDQVVIAYEGTSLPDIADGTPFGLAQVAADLGIYFGQNIPAYGDAAAFAQKVIKAAARQGITKSNVFVAGHSLGAAETEYVAAQVGLSGETFGAPGIPAADVTANPGQLVDYVEYGDPVGNYASQPPVEGRFIWSDGIDHVGTVKYLGSVLDASSLVLAGILFGTGDAATATALGLLAADFVAFHRVAVYAADLGVVLSNPALGGTRAAGAKTLSDHGTAATLVGSGSRPTLYLGSTGNDTIATAAGGVGVVQPGSGNDLIIASGADFVLPGTGGSDTVFAAGHVVAGIGAGMLTFVNGANAATVLGGAGSALISGGAGGGLFAAGAGGASTVLGGAGAATILGGGNGDVLFAGGAAGDEIAAGPGSETLSAAGSTGNDVFFGGTGNDVIAAGAGNDSVVAGPGAPTIFAGAGNAAIFAGSGADLIVLGAGAGYVQMGTGNATVFGGTGADLFGVIDGQAGGSDAIAGFKNGTDHIRLQGYASAPAISAAGNTTITLSDHTQITLLGVSHLAPSTFV